MANLVFVSVSETSKLNGETRFVDEDATELKVVIKDFVNASNTSCLAVMRNNNNNNDNNANYNNNNGIAFGRNEIAMNNAPASKEAVPQSVCSVTTRGDDYNNDVNNNVNNNDNVSRISSIRPVSYSSLWDVTGASSSGARTTTQDARRDVEVRRFLRGFGAEIGDLLESWNRAALEGVENETSPGARLAVSEGSQKVST